MSDLSGRNPMLDQKLHALAAARPDLEPVPDQARRERDLARAFAGGGRPVPPRPARRRRTVLVWGVVAAGAAVAVGVSTATTPDGPQPPAPRTAEAAPVPMSAREILLAAGASSLKAPAGEGDYLYTHWISGRQTSIPGKPYLLDSRMEQEMWRPKKPGSHQYMVNRGLGTAPASPGDRHAWVADGSPRKWSFKIPPLELGPGRMVREGTSVRVGLEPPAKKPDVWRHVSDHGLGHIGSQLATPQLLAGLPTDSKALYDRLLGELNEQADAAPEGSRVRPAERQYLFSGDLFRWGVDLIAQLPVSSALRSAAFGMLSYIPGVEARGEVTDPLGRKGMAVALTGQADLYDIENGILVAAGTEFESMLIVEPFSGRALATADRVTKPVWPPSDKPGQWRSYKVFKETHWLSDLPMDRLKDARPSR